MKATSLHPNFYRLKIMLKPSFSVFLGFYLSVFSVFSYASPNLLLAGGALKTCSSMTTKNCTSAANFVSAKSDLLYEISPMSLNRYQKLMEEYSEENEFLYSKLVNINSSYSGKAMTKNELFDRLNDEGFSNDAIRSLSDEEYFILLDALEAQQVDEKGSRLKEQVSLANTKNLSSVNIYNAFIDAARTKKQSKLSPDEAGEQQNTLVKIGVVTASSRDPFEAVDFYLGVFQQPNVEVVWLPLTPSLQQAMFVDNMGGKGCENLTRFRAQNNVFDRERLYPARTDMQRKWCEDEALRIETLSTLDGIFFNGGDQSKTLAALTTPDGQASTFFTKLHTMWRADKLIVGGTSAGTAVQAGGFMNNRPVPMLTSGNSKGVLSSGVFAIPPVSQRCEDENGCANRLVENAVTIKPTGGFGLFTIGLLDTHFSERNREVRLIAATAQSSQQFGFGVDETTALLVDAFEPGEKVNFSVIGQAGVYIVDLGQGRIEESRNGADGKRAIAGMANFLPAGSRGSIDGNVLSVALLPQPLSEQAVPTSTNKRRHSDDGIWRDNAMRLCRDGSETSWELDGTLHVLKMSSDSTVLRSHYCGYSKVPFIVYDPQQ